MKPRDAVIAEPVEADAVVGVIEVVKLAEPCTTGPATTYEAFAGWWCVTISMTATTATSRTRTPRQHQRHRLVAICVFDRCSRCPRSACRTARCVYLLAMSTVVEPEVPIVVDVAEDSDRYPFAIRDVRPPCPGLVGAVEDHVV